MNTQMNTNHGCFHLEPSHSHIWSRIVANTLNTVQEAERTVNRSSNNNAIRAVNSLFYGFPRGGLPELPPLLCALRYWISMEHKMAFEVHFLAELLGLDTPLLRKALHPRTQKLTECFQHDMLHILESYQDPLLNELISSLQEPLETFLWNQTWEEKLYLVALYLHTLNASEHTPLYLTFLHKTVKLVLLYAMQARLAQEYYTVMGALVTQQGIDTKGFQGLSEALLQHKDTAAWQLCWILFVSMRKLFAPVTHRKQLIVGALGMASDHRMTIRNHLFPLNLKKMTHFARCMCTGQLYHADMELLNCPIFEAYRFLNHSEHVSTDSIKIFCQFCEKHAQTSYHALLPFMLHPVRTTLDACLSRGNTSCRFELDISIGLSIKRMKQKRLILKRLAQSQPQGLWQPDYAPEF